MNEWIEKFILENNLSDEYVSNHIGTFHHVEESRNRCLDCQGLFACSQKSAGQRLCLKFDDMLMETIENCPYKRETDRKNELKKSYVYTDIPDRYYDLNLKNIPLDDIEIKKLCAKILEVYKGNKRRGLYIYGPMGSGKTYMMIAFANSLVLNKKKVAFVKVSDFINDMRKLVANNDGEFEYIMNSLKRCDVLILDDLGSESVSTFSRDDILFNILDYRMENDRTTFFTSNYDLKSLLEHYSVIKSGKSETLPSERLLERIDILSEAFLLKGENRRRKK